MYTFDLRFGLQRLKQCASRYFARKVEENVARKTSVDGVGIGGDG
jgi:hypothetical protein